MSNLRATRSAGTNASPTQMQEAPCSSWRATSRSCSSRTASPRYSCGTTVASRCCVASSGTLVCMRPSASSCAATMLPRGVLDHSNASANAADLCRTPGRIPSESSCKLHCRPQPSMRCYRASTTMSQMSHTFIVLFLASSTSHRLCEATQMFVEQTLWRQQWVCAARIAEGGKGSKFATSKDQYLL